MGRGAGPVESKVEPRSTVTGKSRKVDGSTEVQLKQRLAEALEQYAAIAEILNVMSASPSDVQPVFDAIAERAMALCGGSMGAATRLDGELLHLVSYRGTSALGDARAAFPMPISRGSANGRAILDRAPVQIPDVRSDPEYQLKEGAGLAGWISCLSVPLLHEGRAIGAIAAARAEPGPFPEKSITLLETFARQAVLAIENVRLFKETQEALEQQIATSEILRVISQSPTDVQPVFDTIAAAALKLCAASSVTVFTFDGELVRIAALVNISPEGADAVRGFYPRPPGRDNAASRAVMTCGVITIPDVLEDREIAYRNTPVASGFRSVLAVPLLREGRPIGAVAVGRPQPGPFPETQIKLLQTFADQAVIAIENVRLFNETKEALERQTATGEILGVISRSPTDVQPVFEIISERAAKLCGADVGVVTRVENEQIHLAAIHGVTEKAKETITRLHPMPLSIETVTARAIRGCAVEHISDVMADSLYEKKDLATVGGWRGCLAVPMLRERQVIGAIFVARASPGLFADAKIQLLETFADQAVIAIENVRLFTELEARTAQLTRSVGELKALSEVGQAVSSTLDLETVLRTIVSRATELAGVDAGSIYEYDETTEEFHLRTVDRYADDLVQVLRASPTFAGRRVNRGVSPMIHGLSRAIRGT
jgi:two-component system, NtrC family, sensor kinase